MTNEEIVLTRLKKVAQSPIYFKRMGGILEYTGGCTCDTCAKMYEKYLQDYDFFYEKMVNSSSVYDRVWNIIVLTYKTPTFCRNRKQCRKGANRSVQDIWRIYKNYFEDIDIFSIMRVMYQLSVVERKLGTYRCPAVRKRVFWKNNFDRLDININTKADLGVALKDWKYIGLNNETQAVSL